jgi:hypothetical protein
MNEIVLNINSMKLIPVQFAVLRSRSRLSGNMLFEQEPKFFGLASAPGM